MKQNLYHSQTVTEKLLKECLGAESQRSGADRALTPAPAQSCLPREGEGGGTEEIRPRHSGLWAEERWELGCRAQRNPSPGCWTSATGGRAKGNPSKERAPLGWGGSAELRRPRAACRVEELPPEAAPG